MIAQTYEMPRAEALKEWRSYNALLKTQQDRTAKDMRAIYNQLKSGRKVIDVLASLKMAGLNEKYEPKLAICPADAAVCHFEKTWGNGGIFRDNRWRSPASRRMRTPSGFYPAWPVVPSMGIVDQNLTCPVPLIPARFRPEGALSNYWLLWEVEEWKPRPPTDPMLLKRLTPNMFVVLAAWDLTPLERAVIAGRMS